MLKIKNLNVSYGENEIIKDFSADFQPGTINVVTGLSGCGKTTLLKVLNGIVPEVNDAEIKGGIFFRGHDLLEEDISEKSRYMSTVFQNPKTQFYCIDSTDELAFGLENRNVPREIILETIEKYTKLLKTSDLLDRDVFSLSGGEKQLLAITAVTCLDNHIYLFDEPSASLDRSAIRRFREVLEILRSKGKIVIIAEHRLYYLKELMDNLIVIENGLKYAYTGDQVKSDYGEIQKKHNLRELNEIKRSELDDDRMTKVRLTGVSQVQNHVEDCENLLKCQNFKASYSETVLDFSLELEPGIWFIIGDNGVGKSTFVKRLCNINKGKGKRYYDGKVFRKPFHHISMVMQDVNYQIFTESCHDELAVVSDDDAAITSALSDVGLSDKADTHPQLLSGGEKQRLLIAKTRVSGKPVVILDEPTSGLDRLQMTRMADYLREFESMGKTVIVITHDYELIRECHGKILEFIKK